MKISSRLSNHLILCFDFPQLSIQTVERNINEMLQFQNHMRGMEGRHYNLLVDNNSYVLRWSVIQILVIFITTTVQVYFVRKLFDVKNTRPRAWIEADLLRDTRKFVDSRKKYSGDRFGFSLPFA